MKHAQGRAANKLYMYMEEKDREMNRFEREEKRLISDDDDEGRPYNRADGGLGTGAVCIELEFSRLRSFG